MIFTSPQFLHCYNTNTWHKAMEIALKSNLESQVLPATIIRDVGGARDNRSDGWPGNTRICTVVYAMNTAP